MAICFCGVCIPYNAIFPVIMIALKYIWDWIQINMLGRSKDVKKVDSSGSSAPNLRGSASENTSDVKDKNCTDKNCACEEPTSQTNGKSSKYPSDHFYLTKEHDLNGLLLDSPCVLKFTASWCKPCKKIEPLIDELSKQKEYAHVHFVSVDVDEFEDIQHSNSVLSLPTMIAFHGHKEHSRISGADTTKICDFLREAF